MAQTRACRGSVAMVLFLFLQLFCSLLLRPNPLRREHYDLNVLSDPETEQTMESRCGGISPQEYKRLPASESASWICPSCFDAIKQLPFAEVSEIDTSYGSCSDTEQTLRENEDHNKTWRSFDT